MLIRDLWQYLKDKYYGYTGITGLNQMQNNLTMLVLVLGTFLPLWFGALYVASYLVTVLPEELMWLSSAIQIAALMGEVAIFVLAHAFVRVDATKYKVAPQTTLFMPDGGEPKYTLKIAEEGMREICRFEDGEVGVHVPLKDRYRYDDRRFPIPIVFRDLLLKIPAELGKSFNFMLGGEYWHQGMVVTTGTCENMSIYIRDYPEERGMFRPVGVVGDCTFRHKQFMNNGDEAGKGIVGKPTLTKDETYQMRWAAKCQEFDELYDHSQTLESKIVALQNVSRKFQKSVRDAISTILSSIQTWDELQPSWSERIFQWKNVLYAAILIIGALALARFIFGWI